MGSGKGSSPSGSSGFRTKSLVNVFWFCSMKLVRANLLCAKRTSWGGGGGGRWISHKNK